MTKEILIIPASGSIQFSSSDSTYSEMTVQDSSVLQWSGSEFIISGALRTYNTQSGQSTIDLGLIVNNSGGGSADSDFIVYSDNAAAFKISASEDKAYFDVPVYIDDDLSVSGTVTFSNLTNDNGIIFTNGDGLLENNSDLTFDGTEFKVGGNISASSDIRTDGNLIIIGNSTLYEQVGAEEYVSGFSGYGWRIDPNYDAPIGGSNSGSGVLLDIDHLNVRGTLSIYELLINQIRATNGNLFVSAVGKVSSSEDTANPREYTLYFDDSEGAGHGFAEGDLIRAQRVNMASLTGSNPSNGTLVYRSDLIVKNVASTGELTATASSDITTPPSGGFEYVRLGNSGSYENRQGSIYLTADDIYAPYIDVVDGVDSFENFNNSSSVKVRMGKLDGITSTTFGAIPENTYGFWASGSAYLEGSINATSGAIAGWNIDSDNINKGNVIINSTDEYISLGTGLTGNMDHTSLDGDGVYISGSGQFSVGNEDEYIIWDGTDLYIKSDNLIITASDIDITTDNFNLSSSAIVVSSDEGGKIKLGNDADTQTFEVYNGIYLSGSGEFVIGSSSGAYISFINDNLNISSSNFSVIDGNVSASNAWFDGTISASAGNIGNWDITDGAIKNTNIELSSDGEISSSNFFVSNEGNLTASNVNISGSITASSLLVGNKTGAHLSYTDDDFFLSMSNFSASGDTVYISSSNFLLNEGNITANNVSLTGSISASSGNIGGWTIDSDRIYSGDLELSGTGVISSSNFYVDNIGNITASSVLISGSIYSEDGNIGGWTIDNNAIYKNNTYLSSESSSLLILNDNNDEVIRIGSGSKFDVTISGSNELTEGGFETADWDNVGKWWTDCDSELSYDRVSRVVPSNPPYCLEISGSDNTTTLNNGSAIFQLSQSISWATNLDSNESIALTFDTKKISNYNGRDIGYDYEYELYGYDSNDPIGITLLTTGSFVPSFNEWSAKSIIIGAGDAGISETGIKLIIKYTVTTYGDIPIKYFDNLFFDNFEIYRFNNFTKLTQEGLFIYNNPNQYMLANKDGLELRGGNIEGQDVIVQNSLTANGNVDILGILNASITNDLNVNGNVTASGDIYAGGDIYAVGDVTANYSSDERLKDNIIEISNSLESINTLTGYSFDWNYPGKEYMYNGHDVGLIAQEVEKILPEAVIVKKDGYLSLQYHKIIPLLVNSIKDQQKQIDELTKRLIILEGQINE